MNTASKKSGHGTVVMRTVAAGLLAFAGSQAMAVTSVTLCAQAFSQSFPAQAGPLVVPMWGYSQGSCAAAPTAPGPVISVPAGGDGTLAITLINQLQVPTSVVLAAQRLPSDGGPPVMATDVTDAAGNTICTPTAANAQACRVRSFTGETSPGTTRTYTFTGLKPGTYLYQSGTHPQVQIQMGLAGMARIAGVAAPTFEQDVPVVLSEVDAAMHTTIQGTLGTSGNQVNWQLGKNSTLRYAPNYFLVNGQVFDGVTAGVAATDLTVNFPNANADHAVRLRIANAGLESRSLMLNSGTWKVVGENGGTYPAPREQSSLLVPAGTTADADLIVHVNGNGVAVPRLAFFDRRAGARNADGGFAGGQLARVVNAAGPALAAIPDQVVNPGVALNIQAVGANVLTYALSTTLPAGLTISPTGLIQWTAAPGGPYAVQVNATNGTTVSRTFALSVNQAPVAVADGSFALPFKTITMVRNNAGTAGVVAQSPALNFASGQLTDNDNDPDVLESATVIWVPSNVNILGVTQVDPATGNPLNLPAVWNEATATYDGNSHTVKLTPRTNANGAVPAAPNNPNVNAFGTYRIQYSVTDAYGLVSNVTSAFILVN